jgi:DNA repair exonuclease SbcCD ATPase subunit
VRLTLKGIQLTNFMGYESESLDLSKDDSVLLVGTNGSGKTAIAEAILFGYYGTCRVPVAEVVRKGAETMNVRLLHDSADGQEIVVERGRTSGGKGLVKILLLENGAEKLLCHGNEANDWVVNNLGMNLDTYLLCSFYGRSRGRLSDKLMDVDSSTRWETLQRIARLSVYSKWQRGSRSRLTDVTALLNQTEGAIAAMASQSLSSADLELQRQVLARKKTELARMLKSYRERSVEARVLAANLKTQAKLLYQLQGDKVKLAQVNSEFTNLQNQYVSSVAEKKRIEDSVKVLYESWLVATNDVSEADKSQTLLTRNRNLLIEEQAHGKSMLGLIESGKAVSDSEDFCPLCKGVVSEHTRERWNKEASRLRERLATIQKNLEDMAEGDRAVRRLSETCAAKDSDLKSAQVALRDVEDSVKVMSKRLNLLMKDRKKLFEDLKSMQSRYDGIEIDEEAGKKLQDQAEFIGTLKAEVKQDEAELKVIMGNGALVLKLHRDKKAFQDQVKSLTLLVDGFGKYGVPMKLLKNLIEEIADRATECYSYFDTGVVKIEVGDTSDKPYIDFYLEDRKGRRLYESLSTGEQVMVYLSIRSAISQIMSSAGVGSVDWLVLDEVLGNIAEDRRGDVMRMVVSVLRKMFPRMLMMSHVEMGDSFDRVVRVSVDNAGRSHAA